MADPRNNTGGITIFTVSNNPEICAQFALSLNTNAYAIEHIGTPEECSLRIRDGLIPDLVFLDMDIPGCDSLLAIANWKRLHPAQKIVALSAADDAHTVALAIRAGAVDYVTKPCDEAKLTSVFQQYLPIETMVPVLLQGKTIEDHMGMEDLGNGHFFRAASPSMKQIRAQVALIAKVDVPVLALGESGVGKEIVVRLIHKLSRRANRPFLKVNCAALPTELLESELFGYEAGAFTGAVRSKPGKFELCDKGSILLDEIGEMSPAMQAKLLHVLQDGQYSRLGGRSNVRPDVRIFATTNINMERAIINKDFREDLYYRLSAFTLNIPPLRERRAEIPLLFDDFMRRCSSKYGHLPLQYSEALSAACMQHHWPGNLREFENFVKRYIILRDEDAAISELAARSRTRKESGISQGNGGDTGSAALKPRVRSMTAKVEAQAIAQALQATRWNAKAAAAHLQISYKALLYKMKQYQLAAPGSGITTGLDPSDQWAKPGANS